MHSGWVEQQMLQASMPKPTQNCTATVFQASSYQRMMLHVQNCPPQVRISNGSILGHHQFDEAWRRSHKMIPGMRKLQYHNKLCQQIRAGTVANETLAAAQCRLS